MKSPLAFLDAFDGREESGRNGVSKLNRREATIIATVARALLDGGGGTHGGTAVDHLGVGRDGYGEAGMAEESVHRVQPIDVGIITPYAAQVVEIRRALHALGIPRSLEVKTVDGFQGREKEIILFSCVRANKAGRVGFLDDQRRLNVGLTRARRGLFVVGSKRTLEKDPGWSAFLNHCQRVKCMLSPADLKAHGIALYQPSNAAASPSEGKQNNLQEEAEVEEGLSDRDTGSDQKCTSHVQVHVQTQ